MKGISTCPSGMSLFAVSNKTWLNVEGTLNSWNQANCSIASAGANDPWIDTTQREIDRHKKTIGTPGTRRTISQFEFPLQIEKIP
jgi:hypothetical protein